MNKLLLTFIFFLNSSVFSMDMSSKKFPNTTEEIELQNIDVYEQTLEKQLELAQNYYQDDNQKSLQLLETIINNPDSSSEILAKAIYQLQKIYFHNNNTNISTEDKILKTIQTRRDYLISWVQIVFGEFYYSGLHFKKSYQKALQLFESIINNQHATEEITVRAIYLIHLIYCAGDDEMKKNTQSDILNSFINNSNITKIGLK